MVRKNFDERLHRPERLHRSGRLRLGGSRIVTADEEIDALIARHQDWRGARLSDLRALILDTEPGIEETWKWMGSPVWELGGILCVGNIFTNKVKLVFMDGAALDDPHTLFNAELEGNKRRGIDFFETDVPDTSSLQTLIRAAIEHNRARTAAKR
ncbi:MAG: DUF1801 domain-containing protein [Burkholderiaceae bacterium]|nr:DUF1801 domain-containing protein [Microbacteriaceae bacterium]